MGVILWYLKICGIFKDPSHRSDISFDEWPWNNYPQYVEGGSYLLTHGAIVPLFAAIQTTPMIPFEDVYITGICAEKANVQTKNQFPLM